MRLRVIITVFLFLFAAPCFAQQPVTTPVDTTTVSKINSKESPFATGYYPVGFFNVDLRYFIKYNNYEAFRLGFGGITNDRMLETFKVGGYVARGFKDEAYKYSLGGNLRLNPETETWLNLYYVNDINEIGSYRYLTDDRIYSVFEPRLINITQFYSFRTWRGGLQHNFSPKVASEVRFAHTKVDQIENYRFNIDNQTFKNYYLTEATISFRIVPKTTSLTDEEDMIQFSDQIPKISAQITQGLKNVARGDFSYTKLGVKLDYDIKRSNLSSTKIVLEGAVAFGDVPLTHLFHAYPNSPTKDEILQRFSVAGARSFETMYFGEFFSDKLTTLQVKHSLRRFYISGWLKPELVFITRHAVGDLTNREEHLGIEFDTLNGFYSESGLELNRILFGFGLSFAYRYGFYHLPDFEDNISFKFTFNLKI